MGFLESFVKNVFCDIVKPRIGSVVKVDLAMGADHTGIYIGNDEIVEVANVDGVATVRIVSAEEFIEGDDCISRIGAFIYVACKQDRDGKCIAMGSQDIADRARKAVGQSSEYNLVFNNCHMFTEYCITGKRHDLSGILWGVETALDKKFIKHDYERLLDMWRSTGESRGNNPCFVDDDDDNLDAPVTINSSYEEIQEAISIKREEFNQRRKKAALDSLVELQNLLHDKMKKEIALKIDEIEANKIKHAAKKMTINGEMEATEENITMMLNRMAAEDEEGVVVSADEDGNSFICSCPTDDGETYVLTYRENDKLYMTCCDLKSVQEAMKEFVHSDYNFVNNHQWEIKEWSDVQTMS